MIVTTTDEISGQEIAEVIGLVRGNVIRAKHIGTDIIAALRNLVGGEVREYTKMMAEAREQAADGMIAEARLKGADAIVGMRFTTSMVLAGSAEILAYGTAVRLIPGQQPATAVD